MKKWMLLILVLSTAVFAASCGGKKIKDSGLAGDQEILFVNDTSENTYRITVVGTVTDFTLRASTQKSVRVPTGDGDEAPSFNINIERTDGTSGEARISVLAKGGDTVRIFSQDLSFGDQEQIVFEVVP